MWLSASSWAGLAVFGPLLMWLSTRRRRGYFVSKTIINLISVFWSPCVCVSVCLRVSMYLCRHQLRASISIFPAWPFVVIFIFIMLLFYFVLLAASQLSTVQLHSHSTSKSLLVQLFSIHKARRVLFPLLSIHKKKPTRSFLIIFLWNVEHEYSYKVAKVLTNVLLFVCLFYEVSSCCATATTDTCKNYCQQVNDFYYFISFHFLLSFKKKNKIRTKFMTSFIESCLSMVVFTQYPVWLLQDVLVQMTLR